MVGAERTERSEQLRRQFPALGLQFLHRQRHRLAVVEDHEVGDQVVVLDHLQLVVADVVGAEVGPLRELVEAFALVLRRLDGASKVFVGDV